MRQGLIDVVVCLQELSILDVTLNKTLTQITSLQPT